MKNIVKRFFAANRICLSFVISICVIVNCIAFMPTAFASEEEKLVLSHVEYVDASGAAVMSLQNTDSIYCKATISNPNSVSKNAVLIGALYNTESGLVNINCKDITLNGYQSINDQIGVTVPSDKTGVYTFKVFVWSALSNAIPMTNSGSFEDKKLLSGNTLGSIFSENTAVLEGEPTAVWETEGEYATDSQIFAGGTGFVSDGTIEAVSTTAAGDAVYATLVYDFASQKKVEGVTVWAGSGMEKFDVFLSFDGEVYNRAASVNNTNSAGDILPVVAKIENAPVARFVKIVMKKDAQAAKMDIAEAAVFGDEASDMALLTNNSSEGSENYGSEVTRIETGSDYKWETQNWEFRGTEYDVITNMADVDAAGNNDNLTDGYETSENNAHVCQGGWKDTAYNRYGVVEFDLKAVYQIGRVDVWSTYNKVDDNLSNRKYMDYYNVFVSEDGVSYTEVGTAENVTTTNSTQKASSTIFHAQPGYRGRYVKILMHNGVDSAQLRVGEVAVWGWESEQPEPEFHGAMAAVTPAVSNITPISADLNWADYQHIENGVTGYNVYVEKENFSDVSALTPAYEINDGATKTQKLVNLEDSTQYYAAVTPIGLAGENTQVQTVSFTTEKGVYLLTPNAPIDMNPPSLYNSSVLRKDTGVTATWLETEGNLAMLPITGNAAMPANQAKIFNGNERSADTNYVYQNGWKDTAFDKYTAVVLDFTEAYNIEKIDVWTMDCDATCSTEGKLKKRMESYEVLVSTDGETYTSMGKVVNDDTVPNAMCNLPWTAANPTQARFIKLIFHNDVDSNQLRIGEIAVWGTDAN